MGLAGVALVIAPGAGSPKMSGSVIAGISAISFTALVLLSKTLAKIYSRLDLALMETAGAAILLTPVALMDGWKHSEMSFLWLLVLGVIHTAVGTTLYLDVLRTIPATHVGIIGYVEPVSVVIFAWVFLSQRPSVLTIVGGVLVVGAGLFLILDEGKERVKG